MLYYSRWLEPYKIIFDNTVIVSLQKLFVLEVGNELFHLLVSILIDMEGKQRSTLLEYVGSCVVINMREDGNSVGE